MRQQEKEEGIAGAYEAALAGDNSSLTRLID
jgi:hypothetical protein